MKKKDKSIKYYIKYFIVILVIFMNFKIVYADINFKDIPKKHWAYDHISFVVSEGIMIGDSSGNFMPDEYINKFQAAQILARVAGYKYTNLTKQETQYYQKIYDKYSKFLNQFTTVFEKWSSSADREIAFLLEKKILVEEDLNQFVIKMQDGKERLRALSREEIAMFMVKIIGKQLEATSQFYDFKFADDLDIKDTYKPYVYYLKYHNIFSDTQDKKFNPKSAITRAVMATILNKTLNIDGFMEIKEDAVPLANPSASIDASSADIYIITLDGFVDKYYESLNALQISDAQGRKNIFKLGIGNSIFINDVAKSIKDLKEGMKITATINNNELVEIRAINKTQDVAQTQDVLNVDGNVLSVSDDSKFIEVSLVEFDKEGNIVFKNEKYKLHSNFELLRNNTKEALKNIKSGEYFSASIVNNTIYSMKLNSKNTQFEGTLIYKSFDLKTSRPILAIALESGKTVVLYMKNDSRVTRKGKGEIIWSDIRIGDTVELKTEFESIVDLYASGTKSKVEGIIENVYISAAQASLTIKDNSDTTLKYNIIPNAIDIYGLRIGSRVNLSLDSKEIEDIKVITSSNVSYFYGTIKSIKNTVISILDNNVKSNIIKEVYIDKDTIFIDSFTGNKINLSNLKDNMKVYVIISDDMINLAKTITVLSK